jgi:hypothetical protein
LNLEFNFNCLDNGSKRWLQHTLRNTQDRVVIFLACGAIFYLAMQTMPTFRNVLFLSSFVISIAAGLSATVFSQALISSLCFYLGCPLGIKIFYLMGRLRSGTVPTFTSMLDGWRTGVLLGAVFLSPWLLGVPAGYLIARVKRKRELKSRE